jgi:hypothetical protein
MKLLLSLLLAAATLVPAASQACEKHLNGHQSGSDTESEGVGR